MSLSRCLKKLGVSSHEAAIYKAVFSDYRNDGIEANEAARRAVQERLDDLLAEHESIAKQIVAAGGEMPSIPTEQSAPAANRERAQEPKADETKDVGTSVNPDIAKEAEAAGRGRKAAVQPTITGPSEGGGRMALAKDYQKAGDARKAIAFQGLQETHAPAKTIGGWKIVSKDEAKRLAASNRDSAKEAKESRTPGMANNAAIKRLLASEGINRTELSDITGDKIKASSAMPGTWRNGGRGVDYWGAKFVEMGYLLPESQSERGNEDRAASADDTRDFIRRVLAGEEVHTIGDQADENARLSHEEWVEQESGRMNVEADDLAAALDPTLTREQNESAFDAAQFLQDEGFDDATSEDIRERAAIQAGAGDYESAVRRVASGRSREARADTEAQGEVAPLELIGQTNAEVLAAETAAQEARGKEAADRRASYQKAEADSVAGDFALTGSDRVADIGAAAGQSDLLSPVARADAIEPAPAPVVTIAPNKMQDAQAARVADFGEKIGGARKDVAKPLGKRGSMAKADDDRPAWARKFIAMQVMATPGRIGQRNVGKWQVMQKNSQGQPGSVSEASRQTFDTEQEALDAIPLVAVSQRHGVYQYGDFKTPTFGIFRRLGDRKRPLVKGGFATNDDAMRYMAQHPAEILEHKFDFPERPWLDKIERVGESRRSGDVTTQMFGDTFGFRGGEFGNWNMGGDGQAALNHAYDSLLDFADILGVPPKALSLNGELAIAFGARGHGGKDSAAAHYEPDMVVMNLTKIRGAGSLAHEWWHAVDHWFARSGGNPKSDSVVAGGYRYDTKARPELTAAVKRIVDTIRHAERSTTTEAGVVRQRAEKRVADAQGQIDYHLNDLRRPYSPKRPYTETQLKQWDALAARLRDGDMGESVRIDGNQRNPVGYPTGEVIRDLNALYKGATGRSFLRSDPESTGRKLFWIVEAIKDNKAAAAVQADVTTTRQGLTDFVLEAKKIDEYRAGDYWSTPEELGARAFESYVFDKLTAGAKRSDYLVYAVENRYYAMSGMRPYPEGEERQRINSAFDNLFAAVETKETEKGTLLFSVHPYALLGRQPATKLDPRFVNLIVDRLRKRWPGAPQITVVQQASELGAPAGVTGAHDRSSGRVYIVASNIKSIDHLHRVLAHEIIGHASMQDMLGDSYATITRGIQDAKRRGDPTITRLAKEVFETHGSLGLSPEQEASEIIARATEHAVDKHGNVRPEYAWFAKVLAAVKRFLRETLGIPVQFSNLELNGLIALAAQRVEATRQERLAPASDAAPQYSMLGSANLRAAAAKAKGIFQKPPAGPLPVPGQGASWVGPQPSRLDSIIYTMQDKHVDTRRVIQAINTQSQQIADSLDAYLQEELFHGRAAKETQDFIDKELKPLITEMAARRVTMDELEKYLHARHAEERNVQIAKINPKLPDGGSGMLTADAKSFVAGLTPAQRTAYTALAAKVDAINVGTRQALVGYGLESRATIAAWGTAYKHYVPLQREDMDGTPGTGQGFSIKGPASKRATGSTLAVENILANIAMQRERAIVRGEKNVVSTALVGLAEGNPNPDFWKVDQPPKIKYVDDRTGLVVETVDPMYKSRENIVIARIPNAQGEIVERSVIFDERDERAKRMALALKNLDMDQLGEVLAGAAKVTRYFSSINTQYNPIFGIVNLTRDSQQAMFNLSTTLIAGKQADVAKGMLPALKGIYLSLRGTNTNSTWAQLFEEFQKEGGQTGYRDMFRTSDERAEDIKSEFAKVTEGKAKQFGRAVFDWLSDYNSSMENAVRLSAYKVAKDNGLSNQRAASLAKNLTVNFNRKGQIATQTGALYAFFNASMQGTARLAETLNGPLGKKIIIGGITLGAVQALALAAMGFDDEEPPDFVRERNLIIPAGGKRYITIPMPLGLHFIPNIGRISAEFALSGFTKPAKRIMELANVFADAFNPIGSAGLSLQTIAPTIVDPLAALAENKDWTGKPIARMDLNQLNPTPGHSRAKDTASAFSKAVSQALNFASGGTAYKPGLFSPTPDQIDYLVGQATGGVGRELMKAEQSIASAFTGEDLPTHKIPLLGRFYGDSDQQSSQGNAFYQHLKDINEHEAEIKGRRKAGEPIGAYVEQNPEARLIMLANAAERRISELRKRKRELMAKDTDRETIKTIDTLITQQMTQFNERVKQVSAAAR